MNNITLLRYIPLIAVSISMISCSGSNMSQFQDRNQLVSISEAIQHYVYANGRFPPIAVADDNGRICHSWRVLVLPYLEANGFYAEYDLSTPWNSPANSDLANGNRLGRDPKYPHPAEVGQIYQNEKYAGALETTLLYCARGKLHKSRLAGGQIEYLSPPEKTFLVLEVENSGVHWMAPRDVSITAQDFGDWISIDEIRSKIIQSVEIGESVQVRDRDETLEYLQTEN